MRARLYHSLLVVVLLSGISLQPISAQSPDYIYSETTGHTINGVFLEFYLRSPDPKAIYGEPITEAFIDPKTNRLVQYFEKARFEYFPTDPPGRQVQISSLGLQHYLLNQNQADPSNVFNNAQICRVFPDSGFKICLAFLAFYEANGGEYTFGPPVSDAIWLNGRLVQYFFYSKLEWRPDLPNGKSILVSDLGYEFFFLNHENSSRLDPVLLDNEPSAISTVTSLHARAITGQPFTTTQGRQTVHIVVTDQKGLPLENAQAVIVLRLPSKEVIRYIVPQFTDKNGITQYSFPFNSSVVGMAEVNITVTYEHLKANTTTSFRIWW